MMCCLDLFFLSHFAKQVGYLLLVFDYLMNIVVLSGEQNISGDAVIHDSKFIS